MAQVRVQLCMLLFLLCKTVDSLERDSENKDALCRVEYLVAVANKSEGVDVSILPRNPESDPSFTHVKTQNIQIKQHYLSPACGTDYSHCQELLVMSTQVNVTTKQHIVFVPLENAILLLDLHHNGTELLYTNHTVIEFRYGCSPANILKIHTSIFAVCLNLYTPYLTTIEVFLDTTTLRNSRVSSPLTSFTELEAPTLLSNFEFASLDDDAESQLIYFTTANKLYALVPFSYEYYDTEISVNCGTVERLLYAGDFILIAYCHDNTAAYFDMFDSYQLNHTVFKENGRPYVCPNRDVHFGAATHYIQYGVWSQNSLENFNIPGLNFDSGVCFGTGNKTYFAYIDRERGAFTLDPTSSELLRMSSQGCMDSCKPILVFEDRYMVIREQDARDANVLVVDSQGNFSTIIEGSHVSADLLTLIHDVNLSCGAKPTIPIEDNELQSDGGQSVIAAWVVPVFSVLGSIIFVVIVAIVIVAIVLWKRRTTTIVPISETGMLPAVQEESPSTLAAPVESRFCGLKPKFAKLFSSWSGNQRNLQDPAIPTLQTHVYEPTAQPSVTPNSRHVEGETVYSKDQPSTEGFSSEGCVAESPPEPQTERQQSATTSGSGSCCSSLEGQGLQEETDQPDSSRDRSTIEMQPIQDTSPPIPSTPSPPQPPQAVAEVNIRTITSQTPVAVSRTIQTTSSSPSHPSVETAPPTTPPPQPSDNQSVELLSDCVQESEYTDSKETDHLLAENVNGVPKQKLQTTLLDKFKRKKEAKDDPQNQDEENYRAKCAQHLTDKD